MLDMNFVRENPDAVKEALAKRHSKIDLDAFLELDKQRREVILSVEKLKNQRNSASQEIGRMKKAGENADAQMAAVRALGEEIAAGDAKLKKIEGELNAILYTIPNMPAPDVPVGEDDSDNPEVRRWGEPRKFDFEPQAHWDIGEKLGILDFDRAAKVTGARFTFYKGLGSRLERAVINFFLDINTKEHGYTEMFTPFMANSNTLFGTGQLPKFAEDMFKLEGLDYYLIPTAEVTLTNYHAGEILNADDLPKYYTAYSACFRSEAGSAGRDTRGLIRQHQCCNYWACRTVLYAFAPAIWASAAQPLTTLKFGCLPQICTAKFPAAPTALIFRHAALISVSAATRKPNRNMYIPLTVPALLSAVPCALFWKTISRLTAAWLFRKFCAPTWAATLLPHRKNNQFKLDGSALKRQGLFVCRILSFALAGGTIFCIGAL